MADYQPLPAFAATSGPRDARVVLLGEAWGETEQRLRRPFAGESGKELFRMIAESGLGHEPPEELLSLMRYGDAWAGAKREEWLQRAGILLTNVLALRPPSNQMEALCYEDKKSAGGKPPLPPISRGKYLREEFFAELSRLEQELTATPRNLVVALGATACWALLRRLDIGSIRGGVTVAAPSWASASSSVDGLKVLPTYHPAGVLRQWSWRPIVIADFMKAAREGEFPEVRRPERRIWINPSIETVEAWAEHLLRHPPEVLGVDIETEGGQITCIGFAESPGQGLVIPFWSRAKPGWSYWSEEEEWRVLELVRRILESAAIAKVFQNGLYDLQYILRYGIKPENLLHDTMLLHHSIWPEMQKGLGFMGSVHTNEASWKLLRRKAPDSVKKDE